MLRYSPNAIHHCQSHQADTKLLVRSYLHLNNKLILHDIFNKHRSKSPEEIATHHRDTLVLRAYE